MDQLWKIALCAQNTDVSLTAIQYLNSYYIKCRFLEYFNYLLFIINSWLIKKIIYVMKDSYVLT